MSVAFAAWHVEHHQAGLRLGRLSATLDLARSVVGLARIRLDDNELRDWELLGLGFGQAAASATSQPLEVWPCGPELAALFPATACWPLCTQAVWRAATPEAPPGVLAMVDLKVSVYTDQAETWPDLAVRTALPAAELLRVVEVESGRCAGWGTPGNPTAALAPESGPGCLIVRPAEPTVSYIEMVYPPDFQGTQLVWTQLTPPRLEMRHRLCAGRLEKGVIRRAWVRGVVAKRAGDTQTATLCYSALASSEPPLST